MVKISIKIILICALFLISFMMLTSANLQGVSEEETSKLHLYFMGVLGLVIISLVYLSFKSMEVFKDSELSFYFKTLAIGLIILGINQVILIASHVGYFNMNFILDHIMNLIGFIIIGIGLYTSSKMHKLD